MATFRHSLNDPQHQADMLLHPDWPLVRQALERLVLDVRAVVDREQSLGIQERLLEELTAAESKQQAAVRAAKRREGPQTDADFWRRVTFQLRAIGDAVAWKFLRYERRAILLLGRNQRPGLLHGKIGTAAELNAFHDSWDGGRPALLTGLTNCITIGDILVSEESSFAVVEVKTSATQVPRRQLRRLRALERQLNEVARYETEDKPGYVLQSGVPLRSHWSGSSDAFERTADQGIATWIPEPGVAVLLTNLRPRLSVDQATFGPLFAAEQQRAGSAMGPMTHRIVASSTQLPYQPNKSVPFALLPIQPTYAASLIAGDILFKSEISVNALADALRRQGLKASIALPDSDGRLTAGTAVLNWQFGKAFGTVNADVAEGLAFDLVHVDGVAELLRVLARSSAPEARFGAYICFRDEHLIWA